MRPNCLTLGSVTAMMWFKNLLTYRFTREIDLNADQLEKQLEEFRLRLVVAKTFKKFGWAHALGKHGDMFTHVSGDNILICTRKEEKCCQHR